MTDKVNEEMDQGLDQPDTVENLKNGEDLKKDSQEETKDEESVDMEDTSDSLSKENQELKDKYVRLYSEFENFRRRTAKEKLEMIDTASKNIIQEILPVLDDFERSFKIEGNDQEGSRLIYSKLSKVLESKGLKPMDDLVGKAFDAEYHEAITQIPAPSEDLKGKIVDVVEKGYMLSDKVVRFAKVVIGN
jgi:molecular chaperone GrpE|tara:strand:- start:1680 stop:2249 length:570 start_codon:yes stop_codon:yes gene_type:complete